MDQKFVMIKVKGEQFSWIVNLDQITHIKLGKRELFLSDGTKLEIEPVDFANLKETLQKRTMYADGTPCTRPFDS